MSVPGALEVSHWSFALCLELKTISKVNFLPVKFFAGERDNRGFPGSRALPGRESAVRAVRHPRPLRSGESHHTRQRAQNKRQGGAKKKSKKQMRDEKHFGQHSGRPKSEAFGGTTPNVAHKTSL